MNQKVFGVGLNKTGTSSLGKALVMLGYTKVDRGHAEISRLVEAAVEQGYHPFRLCRSRVDGIAAFMDIHAVARHYKIFDYAFPGDKFILHTRDLESWLNSREKHVIRNQKLAAEGRYRGSFLTVEREKWRREKEEHEAGVREYFAHREADFLEMNVIAGEGWEKLAPFLGIAPPELAFPKCNVNGGRRHICRNILSKAKQRMLRLVESK